MCGSCWRRNMAAVSVCGFGPEGAVGQQVLWFGRKAGCGTRKTTRTKWNTHLPFTVSNLNDAGDLQKLIPYVMELHTHWLRTQRSWWRKSSGSLRCCRLHSCPPIMKWGSSRSATVSVPAAASASYVTVEWLCFTSSWFSGDPELAKESNFWEMEF